MTDALPAAAPPLPEPTDAPTVVAGTGTSSPETDRWRARVAANTAPYSDANAAGNLGKFGGIAQLASDRIAVRMEHVVVLT